MVAVVAPEDDNGVVRELEAVERVEQSAHLRVHERDGRVVGLLGLAGLHFRRAEPRPRRHRGERGLGRGQCLRERPLRHRDFLHRIQVKVFLRRDVRAVRTVESSGDEERLVLVRFEQLDDFGGDDSIGLLLVRALGFHEGERAAQPALGRVVGELVLLVLVAAARIERDVPRRRVVKAGRANLAGVAIMENLPDARCEVTVLHEHLRHRDDFGNHRAEVLLQVIHLRRVRTQAGHHRGATGRAERELAIRAVEAHATLRESVNVRRLHERVAVAAEAIAHIVHRDEEDVGLGGGRVIRD